MIAVFWCAHSLDSIEVKREYEQGIRKGKDVLPLLLDRTPLPAKLAKYHYIDFRPMIESSHATISVTATAHDDDRTDEMPSPYYENNSNPRSVLAWFGTIPARFIRYFRRKSPQNEETKEIKVFRRYSHREFDDSHGYKQPSDLVYRDIAATIEQIIADRIKVVPKRGA